GHHPHPLKLRWMRIMALKILSEQYWDFMMRFDLAVWPGGEVLHDGACRRELLRFLFSAHSM
ncbi:hypothetical protein, partial [Burkholderia multivorans]|uniref:hypothetical protein n=1 Tax=Burkholderia multivorans TaxID=87883 RepID=UPI00287092B2